MNKGSTKLLVMVGLVALLACSWYMLIDNSMKIDSQYNQHIKVAREKVSMGLHQVALENYVQAQTVKDSVELRDEMAQVYESFATESEYEAFCEQIMVDYPEANVAYERLARFYCETGSYSLFYNIKRTAEKRGIQSKVIEELEKPLQYAYQLSMVSAVEIGSYSGGYVTVLRDKGYWGLLNERGKGVLSFSYVKVAPFASGVCYVETKDGNYALVDATGKMISRVTDDRKIEDCTALNAGKMAVKYDGKYHYCDSSFKELFGAYDYAGVFSGGVAVVMNDGKWGVINEEGKEITKFIFDDIKVDDLGVAFRGGIAFAKQNGKYILIDTNGKRIGNGSWDDVEAFSNDMIAAVMNGGKWGFVDEKGKEVVAYQYDSAKSFYNGMAAVQVNGKWGYISSSDFALKIDAIFSEVKDFTKRGTAYVKEDGQWNILQIYRLA